MLKQYVRNSKGQKVGVMVGFIDDNNNLLVGFSRCSQSDKFCPKFGTSLAISRATKWLDRKFTPEDYFDRVPHSMQYPLSSFVKRCEKYFKGTNKAVYLDDL